MKVKSGEFTAYRTARQWALRGYLPAARAQGVELWANPYCQASFVYFSPEEVTPASKEQILAFFEPVGEQTGDAVVFVLDAVNGL